MSIQDVFFRVLFLVFVSIIGLLLGRKLKINQKDLSSLLVYIISPAVMFVSVLEAPEGNNYFSFTLGALIVCSVISIVALFIGKLFWKDSTSYLFAFSGGTGNTGYFGLPLAIGLFNDTGAAIAVFIILGVNLYEFSLGYFLTSRGAGTLKDSLGKIVRLPTIYAFLLALLVQYSDIPINDATISSLNNFKGAYSILGMLIIGITLSHIRSFEIDWKYLSFSLIWKFIAWPIYGILLINFLPVEFSITERAIIMLMCSVPMAGNVVVIANELDVHPEKAATAVMLSTCLALIMVPLSMAMVGVL